MIPINQIFTANFKGYFSKSLRLVFLSEGYTASQENIFYKDVKTILKRLESVYPLSLTASNRLAVSSFWKFLPSQNPGFATAMTGIQGRTYFESYYNSSQGILEINSSILDNTISQLEFAENGITYFVKDYIFLGTDYNPTTAIIVLLPQSSIFSAEGEWYVNNNYYAVATSLDGHFEQIVLRAIGKCLGLGEEYELNGSNFASPTTDQGQEIDVFHPNLAYYPTLTTGPNPTSDPNFKWKGFFTSSYNQAVSTHPHPGSSSVADRTFPAHPVTYKKVEMWEGGGGFRSGIYRSAFDCLMRRRIGDTSLPVKNAVVPFCPVCSAAFDRYFS